MAGLFSLEGKVAAGGYDVQFLPWEGGDLFHAGRVKVLAECLDAAIRRSPSEPLP